MTVEDMNGNTTKSIGARLGEGVFCIAYLLYVIIVVCVMLDKCGSVPEGDMASVEKLRYIFGFMLAFLLGFGDAFHLIPRIVFNLKGSLQRKNLLFGIGNLMSSITMTVFYNILIGLCDSLEYRGEVYNLWAERSILVLTVIRIVLLLCPQNKWHTGEGDRVWAVIRNVPFAAIGVITVIGIIRVCGNACNYPSVFYIQIAIAVVLSFLFYLPVAIAAKEKPKLGMLMIPKTMCYMWMLGVICFW